MRINRQATALLACLVWPSLGQAVTAPGPDAFGYMAAATTNSSFVQITNGSTRVLWFTDDGAVTNVNLGFSFSFYGSDYTNVSFNANGLMTFGGVSTAYSNVDLTTASPPADLPSIAVLWDDWETQSPGSDGVYYKTTGTAGNRQFIVQWNKVIPVNGTGTNPVTFEARLFEGSDQILLSYWQVAVDEASPAASLGAGATVGIRDVSGQSTDRNLQWSYNQGVITNGLNVLFIPPSQSPLRITSLSVTGSDVTVNWAAVGGKGYVVQTSSVAGGGFADLSPVIAIPGTGEVATNYVDQNALTNWPLRFYRIRLAQ